MMVHPHIKQLLKVLKSLSSLFFKFPDLFRGGENIMVLYEAFSMTDGTFKELKSCNTNFIKFAKQIFDHKPEEQSWFGIKQDYILL
jgi:hypothetical protein